MICVCNKLEFVWEGEDVLGIRKYRIWAVGLATCQFHAHVVPYWFFICNITPLALLVEWGELEPTPDTARTSSVLRKFLSHWPQHPAEVHFKCGTPGSNCIVLKGWSLLPNSLRPFQDLLCSPEFSYQDLNMPIKICSEAYFFRLEIL